MGEVIGRCSELQELSRAWQRARVAEPQLYILWGRRRVGKTYLLTHFAEGKRCLYFTATRQDSERRQVDRYAAAVRDQLGEEVAELAGGGFTDWEAALRFTFRIAAQQPLLVVLDEVPRLLAGRPDFADLLSAVWESRSARSRILLALTGSAVSVMEQMLGPQGGLHRRASLERRLDPFPFLDARAFLPDLASPDYVEAYAACGGYPLHLRRWQPDLPITENLRELAFTPGGLLLRDALDILSEDLDWRGGYERVLGAMGAGARRRSRIAGRAQQRIDYTLDRLRRAGYIQAVRPHGAPRTADPMYEIADPYLAFWFAVLREDADLVEGGQGAAVQQRASGRWQTHIGRVFEEAARDHTVRMVTAGGLPPAMTAGRWWRDEVVEVDVLGLLDGRTRLLGEARWQAGSVGHRDLRALTRKLEHLPEPHADLEVALWSRGGAGAELAAQPGVRVFTPDDMI
ncbi:MAG: AAA family ATPase [Actinomycetota bacterium]|nr:AAA family ATPase [Actinomycetota bacterium]